MSLVDAGLIAVLAVSVFFAFVAAVGLLRLPDLYTRTHGASKADTLGAVLSIAAVAAVFGALGPTIKAGLLLVFLFVTSPTAAHAITRAAADQGIEPWTGEEGED